MKVEIPVVLLLFKRKDTTLRIIQRLKEAKISKLYIIADAGRNPKENEKVSEARKAVENAIDWECEVIKNYAETNRGVYGNIALGAKWVFEREKWAIFLEDDNLPELTFFPFCREMLQRYEKDTRVLWVCGTNYLGRYISESGASYMFTKHMLPCGWASWSDKFLTYYDGLGECLDNGYIKKRFIADFPTKAMSDVYMQPLEKYRKLVKNNKVPLSWDYQMCLSVRTNSMFGISPVCNQIKNIGVDMDSEHGGNSMNKVMTKRFCGMESYPLSFPLIHPIGMMTDLEYEHRVQKIVTPPLKKRVRHQIGKFIKRLLGREIDKALF